MCWSDFEVGEVCKRMWDDLDQFEEGTEALGIE